MSITFTDNTSAVLVDYKRDKGTPNVEVLTIPATADATQGDYVVLSNVWGDELGLWLDIDEDGTEPTGAVYSALTSTAVVPIATGGTAAENAERFATVLLGGTFSDAYRVVDNEDGTITLTSIIGGVVAEADPHNADDSGVGSITSTVATVGTATTTVRQDSYVKGAFSIVADTNRNVIVFNQGATNSTGYKGKESTEFKYSEVTSPSSTSILDLEAQLKAFISPVEESELTGIANGEYAATLSDTVDLAHSGWFQPTLLDGTVKYTTVNGDVVTRDYVVGETSLVRVKRIWSTGTTADMGIKVYY